MSIKCKGKCDELRKTHSQVKAYIGNNKRCSTCNFWQQVDVDRCLCCNQILSTHERKKSRKKPCLELNQDDHIRLDRKNGMIKKSIYLLPEDVEYVESNHIHLSKLCRQVIANKRINENKTFQN